MRPPRWSGSLLLTAWVFVQVGPAAAYELRTHGEMSRQGVEQSEGVKDYLETIGVKDGDTFDLSGVTPPNQLRNFRNSGTLRDWMIEGAIREDDYKRHPGLELLGCPRPLNPPSQIDRPIHHFFDVQRGGGGLTAPGVNGIPAPDWALGRQGQGPNLDQNHFSLPDARVYQTRSLIASTREERDLNTALLFRTLGQVTHVLQDMAQPEHTRNNLHAGCLQFLLGERSWYEAYINTRARGIPFKTRGDVSPPLVLGGYSPPS